MERSKSLADRLGANLRRLGRTELRVASYLRDNREEALASSASALAARTGSSDATVIRTVKSLGYAGMAGLRQGLADELRSDLTLAARMTRTLEAVRDAPGDALAATLQQHQQALERLRRDVGPDLFQAVVGKIASAPRVRIFGIGPSSAIAGYFTIQLRRFGIDAGSLTDSGLLLADGLHQLKPKDLLIMLAYGRPYREITALIDRAKALRLPTVLITDTLGAQLRAQVDYIVPVARGSADGLSLHTATLGFIEAVLVAVAAARPAETVASLRALNALRQEVTGTPMDLPRRKHRSPAAARRTPRTA